MGALNVYCSRSRACRCLNTDSPCNPIPETLHPNRNYSESQLRISVYRYLTRHISVFCTNQTFEFIGQRFSFFFQHRNASRCYLRVKKSNLEPDLLRSDIMSLGECLSTYQNINVSISSANYCRST